MTSRTCKLPSPLPRGSSPMMANGLAAGPAARIPSKDCVEVWCGPWFFSLPTVQQKVAAATNLRVPERSSAGKQMPEARDEMQTPRTELAGNRAAGHSPALGPVTPEQQREATAGSYSLNVSPAPATDAHDPEHAAAGPEPQVGSSSLQTPGPRRSLLGQVLQPVRQLLRWLLHVSGLLAMGA